VTGVQTCALPDLGVQRAFVNDPAEIESQSALRAAQVGSLQGRDAREQGLYPSLLEQERARARYETGSVDSRVRQVDLENETYEARLRREAAMLPIDKEMGEFSLGNMKAMAPHEQDLARHRAAIAGSDAAVAAATVPDRSKIPGAEFAGMEARTEGVRDANLHARDMNPLERARAEKGNTLLDLGITDETLAGPVRRDITSAELARALGANQFEVESRPFRLGMMEDEARSARTRANVAADTEFDQIEAIRQGAESGRMELDQRRRTDPIQADILKKTLGLKELEYDDEAAMGPQRWRLSEEELKQLKEQGRFTRETNPYRADILKGNAATEGASAGMAQKELDLAIEELTFRREQLEAKRAMAPDDLALAKEAQALEREEMVLKRELGQIELEIARQKANPASKAQEAIREQSTVDRYNRDRVNMERLGRTVDPATDEQLISGEDPFTTEERTEIVLRELQKTGAVRLPTHDAVTARYDTSKLSPDDRGDAIAAAILSDMPEDQQRALIEQLFPQGTQETDFGRSVAKTALWPATAVASLFGPGKVPDLPGRRTGYFYPTERPTKPRERRIEQRTGLPDLVVPPSAEAMRRYNEGMAASDPAEDALLGVLGAMGYGPRAITGPVAPETVDQERQRLRHVYSESRRDLMQALDALSGAAPRK
jgi:hypothetical protein